MLPRLLELVKYSINRIPRCDILLSCSDTDRSYHYKNKYYSPIIDSFIDYCHSREVKTSTISDRISYLNGENTYGYSYVANRRLICIRFSCKVVGLFLPRELAFEYRVRLEAKIWSEALILAKPKIVAAIQPDYPLCKACNEHNIPIYDMQHGVISDSTDNIYYYSKRLPSIMENYLPSGFLVWDQQSMSTLQSIPLFNKCTIKTIGNLWYERFTCPQTADVLVNEELKKTPKLKRELPIILVTLQYNLGKYAPDYVLDGVMTPSLREVISSTQDTYQWIVRLHPSQLIGKEKDNVNDFLKTAFGDYSNVHWTWCSNIALPLLLDIASLHITHFSATTIEAAWANVETILLDPDIRSNGKHETLYQYERENGFAHTSPLSSPAIKEMIIKLISNHDVSQSDRLQFAANLSEFMADVMSK